MRLFVQSKQKPSPVERFRARASTSSLVTTAFVQAMEIEYPLSSLEDCPALE
jgi:hypothetical protein